VARFLATLEFQKRMLVNRILRIDKSLQMKWVRHVFFVSPQLLSSWQDSAGLIQKFKNHFQYQV